MVTKVLIFVTLCMMALGAFVNGLSGLLLVVLTLSGLAFVWFIAFWMVGMAILKSAKLRPEDAEDLVQEMDRLEADRLRLAQQRKDEFIRELDRSMR